MNRKTLSLCILLMSAFVLLASPPAQAKKEKKSKDEQAREIFEGYLSFRQNQNVEDYIVEVVKTADFGSDLARRLYNKHMKPSLVYYLADPYWELVLTDNEPTSVQNETSIESFYNDHAFHLKKDKDVRDVDCHVLEMENRLPSEQGSKVVYYIAKDDYRLIRLEKYEPLNKHMRKETFVDYLYGTVDRKYKLPVREETIEYRISGKDRGRYLELTKSYANYQINTGLEEAFFEDALRDLRLAP